jgi:acetyl-CoA carboxylase/biotin carboxylase 1
MIPDMGHPSVIGNKPHQLLESQLSTVYSVLEGFESDSMGAVLRSLSETLKSPELAFGEATSILSTLSGRMPADLEEDIRASIESAHNKEFPASKILKQMERYIENLRPGDRTAVRGQVESIRALAERNVGGPKGFASFIYSQILQRYIAVESAFANGSEEAIVLSLRDEKRESLEEVIQLVLAHSRLTGRSKLLLLVLEHIKDSDILHTPEGASLQKVLKTLADLPSKIPAASKVSLKAREILISCSLPSYEERHNQMEKILTSAVTTNYYGESGNGHRAPSIDILAELSNSRFTVYDVLSSFFKHDDPWIILASLTVYILRAYREYSILDMQQEEGEPGQAGIVTWRFKLNQPIAEPSTPRVDSSRDVFRVGSLSDLTYKIKQSQTEPMRTGVMTSFNSLAEAQAGFRNVLSYFPPYQHEEFTQRHGKDSAMPNVLNIALRVFEKENDFSDADWAGHTAALLDAASDELRKRGIRRVTFLVCRKNVYPSYFTFRQADAVGAWKEEQQIRNIEPALASQLELNRLSSFNVTPIFVDNRQIRERTSALQPSITAPY